MMKSKFIFIFLFPLLLTAAQAHAGVAVETSVSRSRVAVGEELTLDIIITNADGPISRPMISTIDGFTSYSQGHSQEINIINGRTTSKSVFSYVLIANSAGRRTLGPFEVMIGDKRYKVAPVDVEVVQAAAPLPAAYPSQGPVAAPPARALPQSGVTNQDIFVRAWLDRDQVYVNEPAMLTYTLYTRLSATYKGFEKEPVTTGFWVEDFPPEKTMRRTEQVLNNSRYVVADVRKIALFPQEAGVYALDPGTLSAVVELRNDEAFDSFFSYNIFGRRNTMFASPVMSELVQKTLPTDKVTLTVMALPEAGRPAGFTGAVGSYRIESSIDKEEAEEGNPVTYRVRVTGQGNVNTVQTPSLSALEDFKVYDSSTSTNISKNRLIVEGEKTTETVIVPKKAGTFALPVLGFSYFDPGTRSYRELKTFAHRLVVKPSTETEPAAEPGTGVRPAEKEDVSLVAKDIRYIKTVDSGRVRPLRDFYRKPLYWLANLILFVLSLGLIVVNKTRRTGPTSAAGAALRFRKARASAARRLKSAALRLKEGQAEEFYLEASKAVYGYFADKFNMPAQSVSYESLEARWAQRELPPEWLSDVRALFDELHFGRFALSDGGQEHMRKVYDRAERVIGQFEKVKLK